MGGNDIGNKCEDVQNEALNSLDAASVAVLFSAVLKSQKVEPTTNSQPPEPDSGTLGFDDSGNDVIELDLEQSAQVPLHSSPGIESIDYDRSSRDRSPLPFSLAGFKSDSGLDEKPEPSRLKKKEGQVGQESDDNYNDQGNDQGSDEDSDRGIDRGSDDDGDQSSGDGVSDDSGSGGACKLSRTSWHAIHTD